MRTYKDAKGMAKSLRDSLAARSALLSHSECLEIVAKQFGFADWNTLSAKLAVEPEQHGARQMPQTSVPEQLSCSFCGKSQHEIRSLIEGGCRNREMSACVFICDECVAFCAQIHADTVGNASSPQNPVIS
jgi:hypothetical protein